MALRSDVEGYEGDPTGVDAPGVNAPGVSLSSKDLGFALDAVNYAGMANLGPSLGLPGTLAAAAVGYHNQASRDRDVLGLDPDKTTVAGQLARSMVPGFAQKSLLGRLGMLGPYQQSVYDNAPLSQLQEAAKQTQYQHMYDPEEQNLMSASELGWDYAIADPDPSTSGAEGEGVAGVTLESDEFSMDSGYDKDDDDPTDVDWDVDVDEDYDDDSGSDEGFGDAAGGWGEGYWAQGGAVGFNQGGVTDTEIIRRFDEKEKNRLRQQEIRQQRYAELEPEERLFSENRIPGGRTGSSKAVIPPGFFNRIPVGIEILQSYQRQQLTAWPDEVMKRYNLKQQAMRENKQTVLKGIFNISNAGRFMTNTLIKPEQFRASLIKSEQETTKENEKKFSHVANSLGLGTTFTLSPDDLNARVNLDFKKNPRSRNISGNVDIPITDDTRVNIAAQRNLIEGGQDSTAYGAGVNTKVFDGVGSLGFNLRRNPRETYGGVKFTMPLN